MPEYIERDKLPVRTISIGGPMMPRFINVVYADDIATTPAADVAPVRHGRWVQKIDHYICSVCGDDCWAFSAPEYNYCPNCGARMDLTEGDAHDT